MGENNKNSENNKGEQEKKDKITRLLAMTHISSIVVVVLAHQFFDIQTEEALAAFYQIPYYSGLFLIKRLIDR